MAENQGENTRQRIVVFQQNGSGEKKIEGLRIHGGDLFELRVVNIDGPLPPVIDHSEDYLPAELDCDLVLDFLRHNDLSSDLAAICQRQGIPLIASGKKITDRGAITPPTCCGLPRLANLGNYGEKFGAPEFAVKVVDGRIAAVEVVRGAPCGATWEAARRLIGHPVEDAARKIGLETQFYCFANPSGWDPIHGRSPVHFAGRVHSKALQKAIDQILAIL